MSKPGPRPVTALPVVQNWDCHNCGDCCRSYAVRVSPVEKARIESQGWDFPGVVPDGKAGHRLAHAADGACVFLDAARKCRIHAAFGPAAKPLACRLYPFILVPAGDAWRVSLRLACPSASGNRGVPVARHAADIAGYAGALEADSAAAALPPPDLTPGQPTTWPDLLRFTKCLAGIMADESTPVGHRLRKIVAVADLCKKSRFEAVTGKRLTEFLDVIAAAVAEDVPADPAAVPPPGWLGRVVFRQTAALYARRDNGRDRGVATHGRWVRIRAAWRFTRGRGPVPKLHGKIPDTTFAAAERPWGGLPPEAEALLTRLYTVKLESTQFAGPTNHRRSVWAGLDTLVLTYPAILWLARVFAADGTMTRADAVRRAVEQVDDHYGFNPLLGTPRQAWAVDMLAGRGEVAKLVAWYGR